MGDRVTRIFLVHAEEDCRFADMLIELARNARLPVEFSRMPNKQPWVPRWKGACRDRVLQCDGAIVLLSRRTQNSGGIRTELEFVVEAQMPILGVYVERFEGSAPEALQDAPRIEWNWAGVASFIKSVRQSPAAGGAGA